jgi:hypothetical protein
MILSFFEVLREGKIKKELEGERGIAERGGREEMGS